eukprot:scaffold5516_cov335-Pinguiococcus_pyrenoidosus.AAC.1
MHPGKVTLDALCNEQNALIVAWMLSEERALSCSQTCAVSTLCTDQGTKVPALTVSSSPERYGFLRTGFA